MEVRSFFRKKKEAEAVRPPCATDVLRARVDYCGWISTEEIEQAARAAESLDLGFGGYHEQVL